jgi:hypothetical protein
MQPKYRFELLIPLTDNQGKPVDVHKLRQVFVTLVEYCGGCRLQPLAPYFGEWLDQTAQPPQSYKDWTLLFTVDTDRAEEYLAWFRERKQEWAEEFQQLEIYLAVTEIFWL